MTESYDANAIAERSNEILKAEFIGYKNKHSIETMNMLIKNSITIYNKRRPHFYCFYKSPSQKHLQSEIKIKTYKNK
jgi:putative transposase